jgi:hypothetical protein
MAYSLTGGGAWISALTASRTNQPAIAPSPGRTGVLI